jgi:hypothetical protein
MMTCVVNIKTKQSPMSLGMLLTESELVFFPALLLGLPGPSLPPAPGSQHVERASFGRVVASLSSQSDLAIGSDNNA